MAPRKRSGGGDRVSDYEEMLAEQLGVHLDDVKRVERQRGGSRKPVDPRARDRAEVNRGRAVAQASRSRGGGFSFRGLADAVQRNAQTQVDAEQMLRDRWASMFAVDLPPLHQAALPDLAGYVKPYDDARDLANQVYSESVPVINNVYDDLGSRLQASQADTAGKLQASRDLAAQQQAAMLADQRAFTAPSTLDESLGVAGPDSLAAQQVAADKRFLDLRAADQAQLSQNMQQSSTDMAAGRQQDAEAMRSGSLGTARTNLDAILSQIGIGRAQAERQHAQDSAQVQAQNAGAAMDYAQLKQQMQQDAISMAQEAESMWADENERIAQRALSSGRAQWEARMDTRMEQYPAAFEAMQTLLDGAGSGPLGRAQALQALAMQAASLSSGDNPTGKKLNPNIIRQWINEYYDETEFVDPGLFATMGGDPSYLPLRSRYQGG